jgi:hypothetical protein
VSRANIGNVSTWPDNEAQSKKSPLIGQANRIGEAAERLFLNSRPPLGTAAPIPPPHYIRIAACSFGNLTAAYEATLYILSNADVVLICREVPVDDLDPPIFKLRSLFSEAPLTFGTQDSLNSRFAISHDLAQMADFAGVLISAVLLLDALFRSNLGIALPFTEEIWSCNLG